MCTRREDVPRSTQCHSLRVMTAAPPGPVSRHLRAAYGVKVQPPREGVGATLVSAAHTLRRPHQAQQRYQGHKAPHKTHSDLQTKVRPVPLLPAVPTIAQLPMRCAGCGRLPAVLKYASSGTEDAPLVLQLNVYRPPDSLQLASQRAASAATCVGGPVRASAPDKPKALRSCGARCF